MKQNNEKTRVNGSEAKRNIYCTHIHTHINAAVLNNFQPFFSFAILIKSHGKEMGKKTILWRIIKFQGHVIV